MAKPAVLRMISGATSPAVSNVYVNNKSEYLTLQVTGTFSSATVLVEGLVDVDTAAWTTLAVFNLTDLSLLDGSGVGDKGIYRVKISGILRVRINLTAVSGGNITVAANFVGDTVSAADASAPSANLEPITAYDMAVEGGYTGTKEQFETDIGRSAENAAIAVSAAESITASAEQITKNTTDIVDLYSSINDVDSVATSGSPIEVFSLEKINGGFLVKSALSNMNRNACYIRGTKLNGTTLAISVHVCWDTIIKKKASKLILYRMWNINESNYGELLLETAPEVREGPAQGELATKTTSVYRYTWTKSNVNSDNPFITLRFCAVFYDSNNTELYRMYSAQQTCRVINGELSYNYEIYSDSQNIMHIDALNVVNVNQSTFNTLDQNTISKYYPITDLGGNDNHPLNELFFSNDIANTEKLYIAQRQSFELENGTNRVWSVLFEITPEVMRYFGTILNDLCEPGTCYQSNEGIQYNSTDHTFHRTRAIYAVAESAYVKVAVNPSDSVSSVIINEYDSNFDYIRTLSLSPENNSVWFAVANGIKYIKVICAHAENVYNFHGIDISSDGSIKALLNPNKGKVGNYNSMPFNYIVSGNVMTSGRLLLPPNYSVDGNKVPLVIYAHGSGAMVNWQTPLSTGNITYLEYLTNEGFAIFDCYPWTDEHLPAHDIDSPWVIPSHTRAYVEGVKYVCSRFNVDVNNVVMLCKSQGGLLGWWAMTQTEFPFRAIAMLSPTNDIVGLDQDFEHSGFGHGSYFREALCDYVDFVGTAQEKNAFIQYADFSNADVISFCNKNMNKFISFMSNYSGISGTGFYSELWDGQTIPISTVPAWMNDYNVPEWQSGYEYINKYAEHNDYQRTANCPVKFWCAFDDALCSAYSTFANYIWLVNGASNAEFREMPVGTGGHESVDKSPNALKSSGTTALGIPYTDMPTAYVEAAEFFARNLVR